MLKTLIALLVASAGAVLGADSPSASARVEHKIARQSAAQAVRERIKRINEPPSSAQLDYLVGLMQDQKHRVRSVSKEECRLQAAKEFRSTFDRDVEAIIARANTGVSPKITRADVEQLVGEMNVKVEREVLEYQKRHFSGAFERARDRAVAGQLPSLNVAVQAPSFDSIDKALSERGDWNSFRRRFHKETIAKVKLPPNLFEENEKSVEAQIDRVLIDVDQQVRHQLDFAKREALDRVIPASAITADEIFRVGEQQLKESLRQFEKREVPPLNILTVARKQLKGTSLEAEAGRLSEFVRKAAMPMDDAVLRAEIERDPVGHRELNASQRKLVERLLGTVRERIAAAYVESARVNEAERPKSGSRILTLLQTAPAVEELATQLNSELLKRLPLVRNAIAKDQITKHFPKLQGWRPTEPVILERHDRSVPVKTFESACKLVGESRPKPGLLREAEQLVVTGAEERVSEGVDALRRQLALLKKLEKERTSELARDYELRVPKATIITKWRDALNDAWRGDKLAAKYETLFARTRDEIEKLISSKYDTIAAEVASRRDKGVSSTVTSEKSRFEKSAAVEVRPTADRAAASGSAATVSSGSANGEGAGGQADGAGVLPGGPGQGTVGNDRGIGSGGDGPPPDATLIYEDTTRECTARITKTKSGFGRATDSSSTGLNPEQVDESAKRVAELVWPVVETLFKSKPAAPLQNSTDKGGSQEIVVRIHVHVTSSKVRHRMSVLLREDLQLRVRRLSPPEGGESAYRLEFSESR